MKKKNDQTDAAVHTAKISGEFIWIMLIVIFCVLLAASVFWLRNRYVYELTLPKQEEISRIVFKDEEGACIVQGDKWEIYQILQGEDRSTRKESVQDYPVNAERVFQMDFVWKEGKTSTVFAYQKGGKYYIEQPYNGIYEIAEEEYWLLQSRLVKIESFVSEEKEQAGIRWEGRDYYMYAVVSKRQTGEQIGIVEGDVDDRVYELDGYDPEKWIVEFLDSGLMDNYVLMKEERVTETIDGIGQDF